MEAAEACTDCFTPLYDLSWPLEKKIETITTLMYGARNVEYTLEAKEQLKKIAELGLENLAVCIAKTQKSLSDDQTRRNRPRDFTIRITEGGALIRSRIHCSDCRGNNAYARTADGAIGRKD